MQGYVIRFFDGDTYETSSYTDIQRYFDDPERRWAEAANLPNTRPIYADVCYHAHDVVNSYVGFTGFSDIDIYWNYRSELGTVLEWVLSLKRKLLLVNKLNISEFSLNRCCCYSILI